jgi:hypothetical protein
VPGLTVFRNPPKVRQYLFREFGGIALLRARDASRQLESDGFYSLAGELPSNAGSSFDSAYLLTNAPAATVRKVAKRFSLTVAPSRQSATIRRNPPRKRGSRVTTFRRNPAGQLITERVLEIKYRHAADGKWYKHTFKAGVCAMLMDNGTVVLYQKNGKPVAQDF